MGIKTKLSAAKVALRILENAVCHELSKGSGVEAADRTGVNQFSISRIRKGTRKMGVVAILKMAEQIAEAE